MRSRWSGFASNARKAVEDHACQEEPDAGSEQRRHFEHRNANREERGAPYDVDRKERSENTALGGLRFDFRVRRGNR